MALDEYMAKSKDSLARLASRAEAAARILEYSERIIEERAHAAPAGNDDTASTIDAGDALPADGSISLADIMAANQELRALEEQIEALDGEERAAAESARNALKEKIARVLKEQGHPH